ncbi:MAG: multiubiquitin domain-containing protein [Bryobacterales bacterium]|nr:multiubiquitin domain-containing protein [Bryobacterales bacterium]
MTDDSNDKEVDLVDLEAGQTEGPKPLARRYRIRIDRKHYIVEQPEITGRELLDLARKDAIEHFDVYRRYRDGRVLKVEVDETIDLRERGVERFVTMKKQVTDGEPPVSDRRLDFQMPEDDRAFLDSLGLAWEAVREQQHRWILIHDHKLPMGFDHETVTLAFLIGDSYPPDRLDMVYVHPQLRLQSGAAIPSTSDQCIDGKNFQAWSRHYDDWREGVDDLGTHYVRMIRAVEADACQRQ